ncbi:MAG: phospho-sugar mutase, partial [Oscillospiraceae bacterium]|nr:phospho-sugar mutase [Oscillospiraceae bacterium]
MSYRDTYEAWLASPALSPEEVAELEAIRGDDKEIESRFFDQLAFGTAGLRGTMGVGLYRMNVHVIRHATQAFAQVILAEGPEAVKRGVAVCFDCRNNSDLFARETACVMAGNGIPVRLFESLRPTPELSFAIREYGCIAGINVTASHNPKEYNGYKVYWEDGAQLPPNHADEVAKQMKEMDVFTCVKTMDYDKAVSEGKIVLMGAETDEKFLANALSQANDTAAVSKVADTFKMVYTPFHGTGYKLIPEALKRLGMKHVICVPEQMVI